MKLPHQNDAFSPKSVSVPMENKRKYVMNYLFREVLSVSSGGEIGRHAGLRSL